MVLPVTGPVALPTDSNHWRNVVRKRLGKSQREEWEKRFGMSYAEWIKKQYPANQQKPPPNRPR